MFTRLETEFPGLVVLQPRIFQDHRGTFVKTFHADLFQSLGLKFTPQEEFFSTSNQGVLRGMHFQLPPAAHAKLVYCVSGSVLDVVLDLRRSSPMYGRSYARSLNSVNRELLFIPVGFAHGFLALVEGTTMVYQTDTVHAPAQDAGILWNSFGFSWPAPQPELSSRDAAFPPWQNFQSPFA